MELEHAGNLRTASSIVAAFKQVVEANPDRRAIVGPSDFWTYRELDERAGEIAATIREFDPAREGVVGLELPRGGWSVASIFAILKAGCAYLPLDPRYPAARRDFLLEDSGCELLVTSADQHLGASPPAVRRLDPRNGARADTRDSWEDLEPEVGKDDLAYIVYTSGSTGAPKGVLVEHGGVVVLVSSLNRFLRERGIQVERQYQFFNATFDATIWEIFLTLLSGRELFIDDRGPTTREPDDLLDMLDEYEVDSLMTTPSFLSRATPRRRSALRTIIVCGEPCPLALAEAWSGRHRVINGYGPTETTCVVTVGEFLPGERSVAIGPPLEHVAVEIVDKGGRRVPRGEVGEIRLGGPSVARGYHARPQLTRQAFDTAAGGDGGRIYRSGDLGYERPDGALEFVGRIDNQVKIRGFRVEPQEIEARLEELSWVDAAAVVPFGPQSGRSLAAYLVSPDGGSVDEAREHLRAHLPNYMVPLLIEVRSELPVLSSGKLDRRNLAEQAAVRLEDPSQPPSSPVGEDDLASAVAVIWAQSLGVDAIADADDFFELGGHSVIAAQVVRRVEGLVGRRIPLRLLFANPTLGHFIGSLDRSTGIGEMRAAAASDGENRLPTVDS
jgi:amino acid adenylation domain-containing protein